MAVVTMARRRSGARTSQAAPTRRGPYQLIMSVVIWLWVAANACLFLWVCVTSFKDSTEIFSQAKALALPSSLKWLNYANAWVDSDVGHAFLNTIGVVAVSSVVVVVVSAPAAYALSRFRTRSANPLTALFAIGMGIPLQAIVIPIFVMYQSVGLINSLVGLTVLYVAVQTPFTVFLLTGFFRSLPYELEEAAALDGASVIRSYREIMLPLAQPGLITALTLNVVFLWNETALVLYLIQDNTKFTLGRSLLNLATVATYTSNWGALFAGCVIVVAPVLITYAVLGRRIAEGMTFGAAK